MIASPLALAPPLVAIRDGVPQAPKGCYAFLEIVLRNRPVRMRSRSVLTRARVLVVVAPVANISFVGVQ